MARALQLGRSEAAAVNNLVHKVAPEAVTFLENSVKRRGMLKYMSHDVIGKDLLNEGYTSGVGILEPWKDELRNDGGQKLVTHEEFQELFFGNCLLGIYFDKKNDLNCRGNNLAMTMQVC